jgi:hypothetical protein
VNRDAHDDEPDAGQLARGRDLPEDAVEIQDLVLHTEVNEFGGWPSITVYFHD